MEVFQVEQHVARVSKTSPLSLIMVVQPANTWASVGNFIQQTKRTRQQQPGGLVSKCRDVAYIETTLEKSAKYHLIDKESRNQ